MIRSDVEHLRGVDCGGVLRVLLERSLIRVLGRKEIPGRPLIYGTTRKFLEVFDLKDLKDLPSPEEIESVAKEKFELTEEPEPTATDESSPPLQRQAAVDFKSTEPHNGLHPQESNDRQETEMTATDNDMNENNGRKNA